MQDGKALGAVQEGPGALPPLPIHRRAVCPLIYHECATKAKHLAAAGVMIEGRIFCADRGYADRTYRDWNPPALPEIRSGGIDQLSRGKFEGVSHPHAWRRRCNSGEIPPFA